MGKLKWMTFDYANRSIFLREFYKDDIDPNLICDSITRKLFDVDFKRIQKFYISLDKHYTDFSINDLEGVLGIHADPPFFKTDLKKLRSSTNEIIRVIHEALEIASDNYGLDKEKINAIMKECYNGGFSTSFYGPVVYSSDGNCYARIKCFHTNESMVIDLVLFDLSDKEILSQKVAVTSQYEAGYREYLSKLKFDKKLNAFVYKFKHTKDYYLFTKKIDKTITLKVPENLPKIAVERQKPKPQTVKSKSKENSENKITLNEREIEIFVEDFGKEISPSSLAKIKKFMDNIEKFDKKNFRYMKQDLEEDDNVSFFIEHYVKSFEEEDFDNMINFENKRLSPEKQVFKQIKLHSVGIYPHEEDGFASFSYGLGDNYTDYFIVVNTDEKGRLDYISIDS